MEHGVPGLVGQLAAVHVAQVYQDSCNNLTPKLHWDKVAFVTLQTIM